MKYDVAIIGAGPAGMTAAIYLLRAGKKILLLEAEAYGGQITTSERVENYPGVPGMSGADLAEEMMNQVRALGAEVTYAAVRECRAEDGGFTVLTGTGEFCASSLILATGLRHRSLGVPGEERLIGKGVSFCAVCDGRFFRGREVAVVGGGSTAVQDALYLSDLCAKVWLIHRRKGFRAEETLLRRLRERDNVAVMTDTVVTGMEGEPVLRNLKLRNTETGAVSDLPVSGVFEAIGNVPASDAFSGVALTDADGYLLAGEDCKCGTPGVFAAGDCRKKEIRQLTTAVCDGTVAALAAVSFLDSQ